VGKLVHIKEWPREAWLGKGGLDLALSHILLSYGYNPHPSEVSIIDWRFFHDRYNIYVDAQEQHALNRREEKGSRLRVLRVADFYYAI